MQGATDAVLPYWDAFILAFSLIAQALQARKKIENWLLWMVVNAVAVGVYGSQDLRLTADLVQSAVRSIATAQQLGAATRAVHAAGYWRERGGLAALREDVGRHNALDKLAGAMARQGLAQDDGVLVLTSRVSVEMVQKAAVMGVQVIAAISAPTALAVRVAQASGIGLAAVVREDGFEVFSGHERFAR